MSEREKNPQLKVPRWFWAAVVGAAVILGGIGLVFLLGMPDRDDAAETSPSTSEPAAPTNGPSTDKCDVPGGDITDVPADLTWEAWNGITWPESPSLGPTSTKDEWPVCFSHSPTGAALALSAATIGSLEQPPVDVVEFWVADSSGKPAALESAAGSSSEFVAQSMKDKGMQLAGFRVDDYETERAVVSLVFSMPSSQTGYVGAQYTLLWIEGDWRLQALDDGSLSDSSFPVNSGQFTEWGHHG